MKFKQLLSRFKAWAAGIVASILAALGLIVGLPGETQQTVDTLTWTNPTTRTDGSPLTNLASVRIQWGQQGGPYSDGQKVVSAPATSTTVPRDSTPGTRCYVDIAVDAGGLESAPSNEACKSIVANPDAVTGLSVE